MKFPFYSQLELRLPQPGKAYSLLTNVCSHYWGTLCHPFSCPTFFTTLFSLSLFFCCLCNEKQMLILNGSRNQSNNRFRFCNFKRSHLAFWRDKSLALQFDHLKWIFIRNSNSNCFIFVCSRPDNTTIVVYFFWFIATIFVVKLNVTTF